MRALVLVAMLPVTAANAGEGATQALHGGLGFGIGTEYSMLGIRAELGYRAFSVFVSLPVTLLSDSRPLFALGLRWSPQSKGGPFLSAHGMVFFEAAHRDSDSQRTVVVLALQAGWRLQLGPAWLEVSLGPAVSHVAYRSPKEVDGGNSGRLEEAWLNGVAFDTGEATIPFDFAVGAGVAF